MVELASGDARGQGLHARQGASSYRREAQSMSRTRRRPLAPRRATRDTRAMQPDDPANLLAELKLQTFDDVLGRRIIETHIWAVREGLRGATGYDLFDGFCQRLVINGIPLWRGYAGLETLHPQWQGYGYTWRRDLNAIQPEHYDRDGVGESKWLRSPLYDLIRRA